MFIENESETDVINRNDPLLAVGVGEFAGGVTASDRASSGEYEDRVRPSRFIEIRRISLGGKKSQFPMKSKILPR